MIYGTSDDVVRAFPRLSRAQALQLIKEHGWGPNTPTAYWPEENTADPHSTFDEEMGIHESYDTRAVFDWLGY